MAPRIRESLREKYQQVLDKRTSSGTLDSPRRRKRALSAAEHFNQQNWIVGCVSYGKCIAQAPTAGNNSNILTLCDLSNQRQQGIRGRAGDRFTPFPRD